MCGDCVGSSIPRRPTGAGASEEYPTRSTWSRRQALRLAGVGLGVVGVAGWPRVAGARAAAVASIDVAPGLTIWARDTWAVGRPPLLEPQPEDVRFLLVHHTAGSNDYDENGALEAMRSAYDFHTGPEKGWPDVAYNFFVDRFGRVFEGRAGSLAGPVVADATGGSQGFAQLVCLVGDFTKAMPSPPAIDSLSRVVRWLADRHGIDTAPGAVTSFSSRGSNRWPAGSEVVAATISGHRDMSQTACPGDTFYPYVRDHLAVAVTSLRQPAVATTPPALVASTLPRPVGAPVDADVITRTGPKPKVQPEPEVRAAATNAAASTTSTSITPAAASGTDSSALTTVGSDTISADTTDGDSERTRVLVGVGALGLLAASVGAYHRFTSTRSIREPDDPTS